MGESRRNKNTLQLPANAIVLSALYLITSFMETDGAEVLSSLDEQIVESAGKEIRELIVLFAGLIVTTIYIAVLLGLKTGDNKTGMKLTAVIKSRNAFRRNCWCLFSNLHDKKNFCW